MLVEAAIGGAVVIGLLVLFVILLFMGPDNGDAGFGELILLGLSIAYILHFLRKHRDDHSNSDSTSLHS